jgi:hypothetical protein
VAKDIEASPHPGENGKSDRIRSLGQGSYPFILVRHPPMKEILFSYQWRRMCVAALSIGKTTCSEVVAELHPIVHDLVMSQVGVQKNKSMFRQITS